jgi:menaquinol-cytochrome c reductase iron-sulfur subunit
MESHVAHPPAPAPGRRGFLAVLAALGGAVIAAVAGVPVAGALLSPLRRRADGAGFVRVARLDALPEGRPVRASVVAPRQDAWSRQPPMALGTVWLLRRGEAVTAFSAVCPHLGCSVDASEDGFACPCHGSAFALDGAVRHGPAPRGLDPLEVRVGESGRVEVRWRRFVIGTPARREA